MRTLKRQQGLTAIGWLFILAIIAVVVLVGLRLTPVYLENFSVSSVLKDLSESNDRYATAGEVRRTLLRRFKINNVDQLDPKDIIIARSGRYFEVIIDYEVRVPFVYNIDFIMTFENQAEVPAG